MQLIWNCLGTLYLDKLWGAFWEYFEENCVITVLNWMWMKIDKHAAIPAWIVVGTGETIHLCFLVLLIGVRPHPACLHLVLVDMGSSLQCQGSKTFVLQIMCRTKGGIRKPGIILWMHQVNEWWRYNVTSTLIGWVHAQKDPWKPLVSNSAQSYCM